MKERFKIFSAVHVFLVKDNWIFLLRRAHTGWSDGQYNVAQGHIEEGETAMQCAIREAKEEAGVDVAAHDLAFAHMMHRYSIEETPPHRVYADFFFVARTWKGEPHLAEPAKSDHANWFPLDQLPDTIIPYIRTAIQNYRKNIPFSELGWE
ncbi:MAG: NUDIX domain-containing protein [bacterium]|nr:NUDIX domain-containing protein [bacterium]